jgi:two-component system, chemotaxis family, sensor kinase CheA
MANAENHREAFREEAFELLTELEAALLELEENPEEQELIGRTFRAMHTIKGSGAMFGFTTISRFTHDVETVFDQVRNGALPISKTLIDHTLKACDLIRAMLEGEDTVDDEARQQLTAAFKNMVRASADITPEEPKTPTKNMQPSQDGEEKIYRIRFVPAEEIFLSGTNPLMLLDELEQLGTCKIIAHLDKIPPLDALNPEHCYTYWDIILTTTRDTNSIKDIFIFVEDDCELNIEVIASGSNATDGPSTKKLGEILVERGDLRQEDMEKMLSSQKRFGELLVESGLASPSQIEAALVEQQQVREVQQKIQSTETAASIRVPSDRLDNLVNLVGELVTVQARLSRTAGLRSDPQLTLLAEEVERLTAELRDNTLTIRMMPIGTCFSKFKRLVRDLSGELGKDVEMITEGADTELDKTVIERLNDPLVHIIRNSIDHGIEAPDVRSAAGKSRHGTIRLTAQHSGDSVTITIEDDGAGLNRDAIRSKAIEKGLISTSVELPDKDLFALIFAPGFSTAKKVTGVSGRGVGMDVVMRAIDSLRGSIDIDSQRGAGTIISIKLPLTLAIIESLLVRIADESFVMPLSLVEECIELTRADVDRANGRQLITVRDTIVPYISLRESFALHGTSPDIEQIVITNVAGNRIGFVVDTVVGEHQTVIKSLGRAYRHVEGISGATILGDGNVALILDMPRLVKDAELQQGSC